MTTDKFTQIMANAQKLMLSEDFNRRVENFAMQKNGGHNLNMTALEQQAFGSSYSNNNDQIEMINATESSPLDGERFSKLPEAIRESFKKTPPMTGKDMSTMGMMAETLKNNVQTQQPMQTYHAPQTSGIDYSLLKALIDESVSRNLASFKESVLNEGFIKGMRISNGNKIQVLDSKGNLYEGVLTLKKKKIIK